MRLRICLLCLLLSLLSGCAGLLNRSYSAEVPHSQFSDEEKEGSVLRAESYQGLLAALLYLISNGEESGIVRLYDYDGPAEQDLDAACLEASTQDPLGAYAVDYIKYDMARTGDVYEIDLKLVYQHTWQQISAVSSVTGSSAILGELRAALAEFQKEKVLRVSYFDPTLTPESVAAMVEEAYYDVPEAAFGLPSVRVQLYPEASTQQQRVVEILLDYPATREVLKEKQSALLARVERLTKPTIVQEANERIAAILVLMQDFPVPLSKGEATAYAALVEGLPSPEGLTLAGELLLQKSGLQCRMVRGSKDTEPHAWVVVQTEDGWQHLDFNATIPQTLGDRTMQDLGYHWSGDIPLCRDLVPAS